ncbi:MAG TPA: heterodisulfide reductase-related iron-sulfur binding cluster [Myxococcota bacterium]|nr:heterodisulfide reductase-related iron-sulfur binding cluster [Myxococcota bacterium]
MIDDNNSGRPPAARDRIFDRKGMIPERHHTDALNELEARGLIEIIRVPEPYVEVETKYGRTKKIPLDHLWHHKSCGQCGHIPGYPTSIIWLMRQFGLDHFDPRNQSSCTGWNYYASATSNPVAQAAVAVRNFAQAKVDGYFPLIHCGTTFGHYKEVREQLIHHPETLEKLRRVMDKLGRPVVFPEEVVHYSEWLYVMRDEIRKRTVHDLTDVTVTVHPACHYHKLIPEDALYNAEIFGGQRTAVVTGVAEAVGARVGDYSTWHDCCGFGFRHILVSRDFTRSFATLRKVERMVEEVDPDIILAHDTGCVTTLDKSQFAAGAHGCKVGVAVMADCQFAALAMGAHPYKVCQLHWHGVDPRHALEKMGIDHETAWAEFQEETARIKAGEKDFLTWEDCS